MIEQFIASEEPEDDVGDTIDRDIPLKKKKKGNKKKVAKLLQDEVTDTIGIVRDSLPLQKKKDHKKKESKLIQVGRIDAIDPIIPLQKKKGHKKKAAKLLLLQELQAAIPTNIYGVAKKLIIFDLNKVLIYRPRKCSRYFQSRPHLAEFLAQLSTRC